MTYPGALIALVLIILENALGGWDKIWCFIDLPSLLCALLPLVGYILVCGYKPFLIGLPAVLYRPRQHHTEIADYFQKLALCTMTFGLGASVILSGMCMSTLFSQEICLQLLVTAILVPFYAGWIALLLFVPIAFRFSGGSSDAKLRFFSFDIALLGIVAFAGVCLAMSLVKAQIPMADVCRQYLNNWIDTGLPALWDVPSLVGVFGGLMACRIAMGKLQNRFDWIPIALLIGVLWAFQGAGLMLADFSTEFFIAGLMVCTLTILYALVFALAVIVNRLGFFTVILEVFVLLAITLVMLPNVLEEMGMDILLLMLYTPFALFWGLVLGFCLDACYYFIVRLESIRESYKKHSYIWIALLSVAGIIFLFLLFLFIVETAVRV